jgi:hypothetical protein
VGRPWRLPALSPRLRAPGRRRPIRRFWRNTRSFALRSGLSSTACGTSVAPVGAERGRLRTSQRGPCQSDDSSRRGLRPRQCIARGDAFRRMQ